MDRSVIITGSTRGIGYETAKSFLGAGDKVVIFCRHREHALNAKKQLVLNGAQEGNILAMAGDVRKTGDAVRIVSRCARRFSGLHVLVNNAGVAAYKPIGKTGDREWEEIIDTNLKGMFLFIRQALPVMEKQRGGGVIINVASALGVEAEANFSAYCASKRRGFRCPLPSCLRPRRSQGKYSTPRGGKERPAR
jgi:NAD(P)-dependent dehydrogenase (short-subunit alcohol dehydrogenase family)